MDQLTVMRSFVGVTKSRSFSQAARTLGISGSLVSRHVAELERYLGVRLVNRTARTISLTEAGTRYAEFATRIIEEIDREEAQLRGLRDKPEGSLAIISPKWIGSNDVGDAIVAFSTRYPKIHIRFEVGGMSERSYEFLDQGFDVAFHTRHVRDCNLMLRKIADLKFVLCAVAELPAPGGQRRCWSTELTEHDCLVNTNDPIWHLNARRARRAPEDQRSGLLLQQLPDPAQGGPGRPRHRGCCRSAWSATSSPTARLVNVVPGCEVPDRPLYALHSPGGQTLARVRLFLDFVTDWFRRQAPAQQARPGGPGQAKSA